MLLNPENYEYCRFNQKRNDGNEYGESGPLYMATRQDSFKLLVKQMNAMDAANEYLACSLAQLLDVNTPKAWLFSSHKQIKRISFRYSVGIEFLDDFSPATTEDMLLSPNEAARCIIFNMMIDQEDGESYAVHKGRIYTYDFASAFTMGINFQDGFIKEMKLPSKELSEFLAQRINEFRQYLYDAVSTLIKNDILTDVIEAEYKDIRDKFLILAESNGFEPILEDIGELYPEAIVDYYRMILNEISNLFQERETIIEF